MGLLHRLAERFLIATLNLPGFKQTYGKLVNLGTFLVREMTRPEGLVTADLSRIVEIRFPDMQVAHGPFKGMRYQHALAHGSSLFPKLLGSYERELHPIFDSLVNRGYSSVVDVGCAEGYYAVGCALLFPDVQVYAYDISSQARDLCRAMAEFNGVSDRVVVREACSEEELCSLDFGDKRSLIICDCEGFEKELLSEKVAFQLKDHDFLIEAHDFLDRSISPLLIDRFQNTHDIQLVRSICDHLKVGLYQYEELEGIDNAMRYALLEEKRIEVMNWFFMKAISK